MGEFRMPTPEEYREFIRSTPSIPEDEKQRLFAVLDYAATHPSTYEEKLDQVRRAKEKRMEIARRNR